MPIVLMRPPDRAFLLARPLLRVPPSKRQPKRRHA
jgi:hypothetical protein